MEEMKAKATMTAGDSMESMAAMEAATDVMKMKATGYRDEGGNGGDEAFF